MQTLSDRFRRWYDHECDSNAKSLAMLESVPADRRETPEFQKAVGRMAHLVAVRRRWLSRLGHLKDAPTTPFPAISLEELPSLVADTEAAWVAYLSKLDDADLACEFEWTLEDGQQLRWNIEGLLTQVNGHAWYHRGQIAQLVALLGGKTVDTDYVFWSKPTQL